MQNSLEVLDPMVMPLIALAMMGPSSWIAPSQTSSSSAYIVLALFTRTAPGLTHSRQLANLLKNVN
jgi:hypothetical protein